LLSSSLLGYIVFGEKSATVLREKEDFDAAVEPWIKAAVWGAALLKTASK